MKYRGRPVPPETPIMGVRRMKDGRYVAFIREANGTMFSAEPRESRDDALEDIFSAMETTGPARVYE